MNRTSAQSPMARRTFSDVTPLNRATAKTNPKGIYIRLPKQWVLVGSAVGLLIVGAVVVSVLLHAHAQTSSPQAEVAKVEQEVGRHYLLPTGEQPVLATVQDESQLSTPFLKQAKNGDKILVYATAQIVIIYRPSIDKIVAVGPVVIGNTNSSGTQQN